MFAINYCDVKKGHGRKGKILGVHTGPPLSLIW